MQTFTDKLIAAIDEKKSILCAGLDPQAEHIPDYLKKKSVKEFKDPFEAAAESFWEFNRLIIDAVAPYVAAVKPQAGFYEQYGHYGIRTLERTISYAKERGLVVILDAKRGDGSDTAIAYARTYVGKVNLLDGSKSFSPVHVDALTVHTWIGRSCLDPFLQEMKENGTGVFAVTKTSFVPNSAVENITAESGDPVWVEQAKMISEWGNGSEGEKGYRNLGVVMGATYPEDAIKMREILPNAWFLVPGYGAQGGGAEGAVIGADGKGFGIIVNSSRGITRAYLKGPFQKDLPEGLGFEQVAAQAAKHGRDELNEALRKQGKASWL